MKLAIIFGGAGYIGSFLIQRFRAVHCFDKIIVCDLNPPGKYFEQDNSGLVRYFTGDVRNEIELELPAGMEGEQSWIFNFAAVHREPGHSFREYFDTNIPGARNVCHYAVQNGIRNIFFTSSIAPYGKSLHERDEQSGLYPETAYGISKALAEEIHRTWLAGDPQRRLVIVRPSVIFGPRDPGNVYRMIGSLKKGTFILPDGGRVIKAYGYVIGLIDSMLFVMGKKEQIIVYNYAENPLVDLREMTKIVKEEFGYGHWVPGISVSILSVLAFFIQKFSKIIGKDSDIHPVRVQKAGFPTNIKPGYLMDNNFEFKYHFAAALKHWKETSPGDFQS